MSGETWRSKFQVGKETTPGTIAPATRVMYFEPASALTRERDSKLITYATGTRDNQRGIANRAVKAGGKVTQVLSSDEIVELLLAGMQGGVTPTQNASTGQYDWVFKPGTTLDSQSYEWYDGYRGWVLNGTLVDELKLSGSVSGDAMVEATLFGRDLAQQSLTGSLVDHVPGNTQGWEAKIYVDAFGAAPGTTVMPSTMISWTVDFKNNAKRKYFADNTTAAGAVVLDALQIDAEFVLEANASGFAEFGNWDSGTKRLIRLELGNNGPVIGTSTVKPTVWIDLPGAWLAADLSGTDNATRVFKMKYSYIFDPTNNFGVQITARNDRAVAY